MTTKFLDNKIRTFKFVLSWRFPPKKNSVFGQFSSLPPWPTPFKSANFIFIVVSPSLKFARISRKWTCLKRPLDQNTPFSI